MRGLVAVIIGIITFLLIIFYVDPYLVDQIMSLFPDSAKDWFKLIRFVAWLAVLFFTTGLAIVISTLVGIIVSSIFQD